MCCGNDRKEEYFWKFKDGHLDNVCKHCRLKTIDDSKPETFIPLMQMFDIPYIKHEWEWLVQYQREKAITRDHEYVGAFGKYLSINKVNSLQALHGFFSVQMNLNFRLDEQSFFPI